MISPEETSINAAAGDEGVAHHQQQCEAKPKLSAQTPSNVEALPHQRKSLNLVVIGHVDAGKSTTTGHLLVKCGGIEKRVLDKLEKEANEIGKGSFKYAWALDKLKSERERGITIDTCHSRFETKEAVFTIIDAPGHRDFIKNMISGAAQADAAILMVSVLNGEFETGFSEDGQTKEHALLAFSLGVRQIIVCCNKMDDQNVNYSEKRFDEVAQEVGSFVRKLGFDKDKVPIIPMSGWKGDNIVERSQNTPWYKGPTLVEALNALEPPARDASAPLRVPLQDIYKISGIGVVAVGRVETGTLRPGDEVVFAPGGAKATVSVIELHNVVLKEATPGMYVGFSLKGIQLKDLRRGYVCGHASPQCDPPDEVVSFDAQIVILNKDSELSVGYTPLIDCHTAHIACKFDKLYSKIDRRSGRVIEELPKCLKFNDAGLVKMVPSKPMCVEAFGQYAPLGRIAVRDDKHTIAIGIVKTIRRKRDVGDQNSTTAAASHKKQ